MTHLDRRHFCATSLLALFGVSLGCEKETPVSAASQNSAGRPAPEKAPAENAADSNSGKALWDSVPETPLPIEQQRISDFAPQRNYYYKAARKSLDITLSDLSYDLERARQGHGPWAKGDGCDYVAGQAAAKITRVVVNFETKADIDPPVLSQPQDKRLTAGLENLVAAISRAKAMTAQDFSIVTSIFHPGMSEHDHDRYDKQKAFLEAAVQIFPVLNKVRAIQVKAGWRAATTSADQAPVSADSSLSSNGRPGANITRLNCA